MGDRCELGDKTIIACNLSCSTIAFHDRVPKYVLLLSRCNRSELRVASTRYVIVGWARKLQKDTTNTLCVIPDRTGPG